MLCLLGICGEHAGDAASIAFCEELGLDYVSLLSAARTGGATCCGAKLRCFGRRGCAPKALVVGR